MIHLLEGVNHARPEPQDLDSGFTSDALGEVLRPLRAAQKTREA